MEICSIDAFLFKYNKRDAATLCGYEFGIRMKHVFVVNPQAGGHDKSEYIAEQLKNIEAETEVYVTREPRDATRYVAERSASGEALRFYACGGDGTLNEVVSGAIGCPNVEVGCYPCGSGNDYVKNWPEADFHNLKALVEGTAVPVDMLQVGDRYCVNVMNFGFEAEVCRMMERVRRWPLLGGKMAYVTGIVYCLLHKRHNPCSLTVDGEVWHGGDLLLGSAANGRYVGGGYQCAPRAVVDDGWLEAQCVDALSIARFLKMIGAYRRGEHLDRVDMHDVVHHRRARQMVFESDRDFSVVIDGELMSGRRFEAHILPKAIEFIIPNSEK